MARSSNSAKRSRWTEGVRGGRYARGLLVVVVVAGCYGQAPPPRPAGDEMHAHFQAIRDLRVAAIRGDRTAMSAAAEQLSGRGGVELSEDLQPILYDLRRLMDEVRGARTLEGALRSATGAAAACGRCHAEARVGLAERFVLTVPREDTGLEGHAERLSWAVDRLWEGLVGPSDRAWRAGARAVPDPQALGPELSTRVGDREELEGARARLAALARMAVEAEALAERADLAADVLETCASCHLANGP